MCRGFTGGWFWGWGSGDCDFFDLTTSDGPLEGPGQLIQQFIHKETAPVGGVDGGEGGHIRSRPLPAAGQRAGDADQPVLPRQVHPPGRPDTRPDAEPEKLMQDRNRGHAPSSPPGRRGRGPAGQAIWSSCPASVFQALHRGGYLAAPVPLQRSIAAGYDAALEPVEGLAPDFFGAVEDLTATACAGFNREVPDAPGDSPGGGC